MLHAILGLILLIVLVCNPDFVRRAYRRSPRRRLSCGPLPPAIAPTKDGRPWVDRRGGLGLVRLAESKAKLIMDFLARGGATVQHEGSDSKNAACQYS